jgi:hypothetical protein
MRRLRVAALTTFVIASAAVAVPIAGSSAAEVQVQAAADGQSIVSTLAFSLSDPASGDVQLVSRDPGAWASDQLASGEYRYFSSDLSCAVLTSPELLAPGAPTGVAENLFRHEPFGAYTVLSNLTPTNATAVDAEDRYRSINASADCGHVVFRSAYVYPGLGASGLYEWEGGALRNVGVLPDGGVASGATLGAVGGTNMWNAVSDDGSRVFFSATGNDGADAGTKALFVRKDGTSTVKASASKTATPSRGAVYQFASESGSHVLFLANYGLTSTTSAGPTDGNCSLLPLTHCDLYDYDVETGELTDLSAHTAETVGGMATGVLGASDDASYVYFAARGRLVPGQGRSAAANLTGGTHNVYLAHGGQRFFVGLLGGPEAAAKSDRNGALISRSTAPSSPWASRVSPDGSHLLFPSSANVIGYDSGGVADAYLYDAEDDLTLCVSCSRDFEPSVGVPAASDEGATTPLASDGRVGHNNPLHPPRTLSDDGSHVFFEKPDALTAGAVSGRDNVYEWNDSQISLLAVGSPPAASHRTQFEDASASGDDVFVSTLDRLVPRDVDTAVDVYDMRVGGGLARDSVVPPCDPLGGSCPDIADIPPPFQKPPAARGAFSVKALLPRQRARLVAGKRVSVAVKVNRAGKVSVKGAATLAGARVTVFAGSRKAKRKGTVKVPIALTKAARARIGKAGSLRVKMTVSFAGVRKRVVRSIVLERPKPPESSG